MTAIYIHRLYVTVVTEECSPDIVEKTLDAVVGTVAQPMRVYAETDKANRAEGRYVALDDRPKVDRFATGREFLDALDGWRDLWPLAADEAAKWKKER